MYGTKSISNLLDDIDGACKDGRGHSAAVMVAINNDESPSSALDNVGGCFDDIDSYVSNVREKLKEIEGLL